MHAWLKRTDVVTFVMIAACIGALAFGYVGATLYIAVARPASAAAAVAEEETRSGPLVVHATGDVNLDPAQLGLVRSSYYAPWSGVRPLFEADDLSIVNLECAPSALGSPEEKEYTFRCPRGFTAMRESGVDVANLGNNHAGDFGKEALLDGRSALIRAGVVPVAAGRNAAQANSAALFERKGKTIAVLGFAGVVPTPAWFASSSTPGVADGYDTGAMVRAVRAADAAADVVLVTIHWGAELETQPREDDVARARALIDAGADAVFGHHAHVLQPVDFYKDRPIFYGLGNFVWPSGGPTAVARVVVRENGRIQGCLLPATISGGRPTLDEPPDPPTSRGDASTCRP